MHAIITTFDNSILKKLKDKYDGQEGIIGCEKVHVRANYELLISMPG